LPHVCAVLLRRAEFPDPWAGSGPRVNVLIIVIR